MHDVIGMPSKGWFSADVHHLCLWQSFFCLCFQNVHWVLREGCALDVPFGAAHPTVHYSLQADQCGSLYLSLNYRLYRNWDTDVDRVTFWFSFTCPCRVYHPLAEPPACICPSLLSPATWPHSLYRTSVTNRKQHAQWGRGLRDKRSLSPLLSTQPAGRDIA